MAKKSIKSTVSIPQRVIFHLAFPLLLIVIIPMIVSSKFEYSFCFDTCLISSFFSLSILTIIINLNHNERELLGQWSLYLAGFMLLLGFLLYTSSKTVSLLDEKETIMHLLCSIVATLGNISLSLVILYKCQNKI